MQIQQQLIFLFSALGAINGFLLSGYFFLKKTERRLSDYFLGGLLLMLSIRIIKSVFLHFNAHLFGFFIEFGLAACALIGPFLLLYVKSMTQPNNHLRQNWWQYILPYLIIMLAISIFYPYYEYRGFWSWFIEGIYKQWMIYIIISGYLLLPIFKKVWQRKNKLTNQEFWLLNIFTGTAIIWLAYETSNYTSYIVGALSFTFILYISILLKIYIGSNRPFANDEPLKYANSSLSESDVKAYMRQLNQFVTREKPYLDPNLTLVKLSKQLGLKSKDLSQVINQSTGENYSLFISKLRIEEAKRLLSLPEYKHYKIAAIAYDSGFNSLSSFNTSFAKLVGMSASEFRKQA